MKSTLRKLRDQLRDAMASVREMLEEGKAALRTVHGRERALQLDDVGSILGVGRRGDCAMAQPALSRRGTTNAAKSAE